jgi:hypothetical protein
LHHAAADSRALGFQRTARSCCHVLHEIDHELLQVQTAFDDEIHARARQKYHVYGSVHDRDPTLLQVWHRAPASTNDGVSAPLLSAPLHT